MDSQQCCSNANKNNKRIYNTNSTGLHVCKKKVQQNDVIVCLIKCLHKPLQSRGVTFSFVNVLALYRYSYVLGRNATQSALHHRGSGSTYIYGYLDAKFKPDMSLEEAMQFSKNGT